MINIILIEKKVISPKQKIYIEKKKFQIKKPKSLKEFKKLVLSDFNKDNNPNYIKIYSIEWNGQANEVKNNSDYKEEDNIFFKVIYDEELNKFEIDNNSNDEKYNNEEENISINENELISILDEELKKDKKEVNIFDSKIFSQNLLNEFKNRQNEIINNTKLKIDKKIEKIMNEESKIFLDLENIPKIQESIFQTTANYVQLSRIKNKDNNEDINNNENINNNEDINNNNENLNYNENINYNEKINNNEDIINNENINNNDNIINNNNLEILDKEKQNININIDNENEKDNLPIIINEEKEIKNEQIDFNKDENEEREIENINNIKKEKEIKIEKINNIKKDKEIKKEDIKFIIEKNEENEDYDFIFISEDLNIQKTIIEAKWIEIENIYFKNIGKTTFWGGDLYFLKGEGSSEDLYFVGIQKDKKQGISLEDALKPNQISQEHNMTIRIEEPIIGNTYFFNVFIKSDKKEIKMKKPLRIIINIINDKD